MPAKKKTDDKKEVYGLQWNVLTPQISIEMYMIKKGGRWIKKSGGYAGEGLYFHYRKFIEIVWPEIKWHRWLELLIKSFCEYRFIGVMGPASSSKTFSSAIFALVTYYVWSDQITVICTSTERERLEERVWGEMKRHHKFAKARFPWLPGNNIDSRQRIVTDDRYENIDGRDFRNGCVGVACRKGGSYVGLGSFAGCHNKYVMLVADESSLLPVVFVDAISNMNKNVRFKAIVVGNPKDTTDALGKFCEPSSEVGGWDGGIDQQGKTKTWPIRYPEGICVQLVGSDSPNMDVPPEAPVPFPFLITRKAIDSDIAFYGKDSLQFTMMNEGRMPKGAAASRVLTRQLCLKFHAMEEPMWADEKRTRIAFADIAYARQGGDRSIFGYAEFGKGINYDGKDINLFHLCGTSLIPNDINNPESIEDQNARYCKEQCEALQIPPDSFFFDSTGRGSFMNACGRLWSPHVNGIEFGGKASDRQVSNIVPAVCRDYYFNFVSELWFSVRLIVEAGQFRGMTQEVMQEFCFREWGKSPGNKIKVETKEEMKVKSGRSPDNADCVCCGTEGARRKGFQIAKLSNLQAAIKTSEWKRDAMRKEKELHEKGQLNYKA